MASNTVHRKLNIKKFAKFIVVFAALTYVAVTLVHQRVMLNERYTIAKEYENQISDAELKQQTLKNELEKVNSPEYLEKLAREKLGLVKPNDRVFVDVTKN